MSTVRTGSCPCGRAVAWLSVPSIGKSPGAMDPSFTGQRLRTGGHDDAGAPPGKKHYRALHVSVKVRVRPAPAGAMLRSRDRGGDAMNPMLLMALLLVAGPQAASPAAPSAAA